MLDKKKLCEFHDILLKLIKTRIENVNKWLKDLKAVSFVNLTSKK